MKLKPGMREKPNGSIEYRLVINGKRYSICAKSMKELMQKEQDLRVKIANNEYIKSSACTFAEYAASWIERKKPVVKPNTIRSYSNTLRHALPEIGKVKLSSMDALTLESMRDAISENISATSANATVMLVKTILASAATDGLINASYIDKVKYIPDRRNAVNTIHRALTKEEQKIFFDEAKNSFLYEALLLMVATGIRPGEAAALEWSDIDSYRNVIHISKTWSRNEKGIFFVNSTKTESSTRDIPITSAVSKILEMQKNKMQDIGFYGRSYKRVFYSIKGSEVNTDSILKTVIFIERRLKKKGIEFEHFSSHGLRDTFATRFIENGGSMKTLQTILGHSSITMTMDLYAHVLPDTKKDEMERIEIDI